jgi:hypothetical protein
MRQGGWHRLWRPVLALLVVLVLPWLVGAAVGPAPDFDRAADAHSVTHVEQSRMGAAPGGHRVTASAVPNVPFATVSLDAVCPAGPASPVSPRFWHGYVAAAFSVSALATTASRGRSPPAP